MMDANWRYAINRKLAISVIIFATTNEGEKIIAWTTNRHGPGVV